MFTTTYRTISLLFGSTIIFIFLSFYVIKYKLLHDSQCPVPNQILPTVSTQALPKFFVRFFLRFFHVISLVLLTWNLFTAHPSASTTPCRNILIHGYCKFADKGCAFNHDAVSIIFFYTQHIIFTSNNVGIFLAAAIIGTCSISKVSNYWFINLLKRLLTYEFIVLRKN